MGSHFEQYKNSHFTPKDIGDNLVTVFKEAFSDENKYFFKFLDLFPYFIAIFSPDGTIVYLNQAGFDEVKVTDPDKVIGRYNILKDLIVLDTLNLRDGVERAFSGEKVFTKGIRFPADRYNKQAEPFIKVVIQNVSLFPIHDENQQIAYIIMVAVNLQEFEGRKEIVKVLEYMNKHWQEEFNRDELAKIANLSVHHFSRLFRENQGMTPQDYYKKIKIEKLCEKLLDPNLNITQAFSVCGVDVKGRYMKYFKDAVGLTPLEYRNKHMSIFQEI